MKKQSQIIYKKELKTLQNLIKSISSEYYMDMHVDNYLKIQGKYTLKHKIENTKNMFCKYHPDFDIETFNKFPDHFLEEIVENDTTIYFDEKYIYLELYKILFLIYLTMQLQKYIKTSKYQKHLKKNKNLKSQKRSHKQFILPSSYISDKGEHRLNYHYLNSLLKEKKATKFFMYILTLMDLEKVAMLYKEKKEHTKKLLSFIENRLIEKTTDKSILKSLGILLHYEFKKYLKIEDLKSKDYITDIMKFVFETSIDYDGFNRHIYMTSTIYYFPIFGAKKTNHYLNKEKKLIKDFMFKHFYNNKAYKFDSKILDKFFDIHLKTQHLQYLDKYPSELFTINKKYSHLKPFN